MLEHYITSLVTLPKLNSLHEQLDFVKSFWHHIVFQMQIYTPCIVNKLSKSI